MAKTSAYEGSIAVHELYLLALAPPSDVCFTGYLGGGSWLIQSNKLFVERSGLVAGIEPVFINDGRVFPSLKLTETGDNAPGSVLCE